MTPNITPSSRARAQRIVQRSLGRWCTAKDRNRIIRLAALAGVPVVVKRLHLGPVNGEGFGKMEVFK